MMSRHSNLPPRCPLQNKCLRTRSLDPSDLIAQGDDQCSPELFRHQSMDFLLEENTSWLDDLLTDSDSSPQGRCHRRSASDSLTISHGYDSLRTPTHTATLSSVSVNEAEDAARSMDGGGLEANCVYGPNSPRQMSKLTNSESAIVNALLDKVPRNRLQYAESSGGSRIHEPGHGEAPSAEPELERTSRRRSGQRSRVRKLQYISDLQKTVEALETMGAELATQVATLFQQRIALSLENKYIRQQISILLHEKIIKDGEHRCLKNEAEKLKMISGRHRRSKSISSPYLEPGQHENVHSGTSWQSLDFRKLSLGESSVPFNHGLGH
ncbi:basic leucine zipper 61 [Phalaenopsis equestris]|uniref:basic leucine zipper 61 n=1 Tax=Phalaenopsis equestris TaxID=78828 RepID=UPI0009E52169|nr:basic leucine zipper 61 [Phalaenopsis equestris]XP_020573726.1 basic leucine zipper 61 [Phalaenopsis equestris]XP_020573727.1 basic leucine zipper 61 [Phalaenopsis equestris]XP_020573728.1 basic leucine zipper 61 [Phalaenopsis equestris]